MNQRVGFYRDACLVRGARNPLGRFTLADNNQWAQNFPGIIALTVISVTKNNTRDARPKYKSKGRSRILAEHRD